MRRQYGRLFVFEGPDGSGKTTLSHAFTEYLKLTGVKSDHFSFPGQEIGTVGKLIHDLHHNPGTAGINSITPSSLQLLHVAAHIDAIEARILPSLRKGRTVVLDRFWWSTWVYGKITKAKHLQAVIELERACWGDRHPAMVFLIQRNPCGSDDSIRSLNRLSAQYSKLAIREASRNPVRYIRNDGTVAEAVDEVIRQASITGFQSAPLVLATSGSSRRRHSRLPLRGDRDLTPGPLVLMKLAPAKPTVVYDTFWRFAAERQAVFFRRLTSASPPWTDDVILREHKFTNAYRASDRVSQYLLRHVIYKGDQSGEEVFFRTLLFKFFNKIETWELLLRDLGTISLADYSFARYDEILSWAVGRGAPIYSGAYIMPSGGPSSVSDKKHRMHLKLLERMTQDEVPARLADSSSMKEAFELLRSYPTIGDFLAYQYVTDLNYSTLINFNEMEFAIPGPGARDGIRKCFTDLGGLNETEIIRLIADRQQAEFNRLGLDFESLWGRPLQLIDCQNLFCEVDKYARIRHPEISGITGRTRIKQKYRINPDPISFWYPPKWGLNERIANEEKYVSSL